nr:MAG TPA: hypothetical protein [Caudoviricetes sp.]
MSSNWIYDCFSNMYFICYPINKNDCILNSIYDCIIHM